MAVPIARKTLLHEWRRFLPAVIAVAFSGVLMIAQGALLLGIVGANALYVSQSNADLWVGFPGTQSVELGRTLKPDSIIELYSEAGITHIERFLLGSGDWRSVRESGGVSVNVVGIDPSEDAVGLARIIPPALRDHLKEPASVVVDVADAGKLSASVGQIAEINGHEVRLIGFIDGLRGLGGVNVVGSLDTARTLDQSLPADGGATYFLCSIKDRGGEAAIIHHFKPDARGRGPRFEIWPAADLAEMSTSYMLLESGAGVAFAFATLIALVIGAMITSQTLLAAVAGTIPQYATLLALGVPFRSLQAIVIEQAVYVGAFGLLLSASLSLFIAQVAAFYRVPFELRLIVVVLASLVLLIVAMIACVIAVRRLRDADPATLLR